MPAPALAGSDRVRGDRRPVDRAGPHLDDVDAELVDGSILDAALLDEVFAEVDAVVHLAAQPSVPRSIEDPMASHEVNATGTLRVLEAARAAGPPRRGRLDLRPDPVDLAFGTRRSSLDVIAEMEALLGVEVVREHGPRRVGDIQDPQADGSRLAALFPALEPVRFREGSKRRSIGFGIGDPVGSGVLRPAVQAHLRQAIPDPAFGARTA